MLHCREELLAQARAERAARGEGRREHGAAKRMQVLPDAKLHLFVMPSPVRHVCYSVVS